MTNFEEMQAKSKKNKNRRLAWGTAVLPQGQSKRRSESALSTSSANSVDPGKGIPPHRPLYIRRPSLLTTRTPCSILTLSLGRKGRCLYCWHPC
ncbi:hypothetical protein Pcinc_008638 [Petrolisthes cinctipes]|uniref:Uncharacterized protein n=1 Tax=Petrolisthes cinctipes TaxID=88211 RepID=A0AAE1KXB3_PETCI|nr:hypothetical protein Pcinc_008638 [Petrolisthes cinctipes]